MNVEELREQLELLSGPSSATPEAREGVRRRVRRTRLRAGAASAVAAVLVVALLGLGVRDARRSPIDVRTVPSSTPVSCDGDVGTTPPKEVPSDVAKWAGGAPVVGHGALWTIRSAIDVAPDHQGDVWRLKFPWFTRPFGLPKITGRRLDGPGGFHSHAGSATDARGTWAVSTLEFSAPGCWEVTAGYRNVGITFRILVGEPLGRGTIAGTLREIGGRPPGLNRTISGTVSFEGTGESAAASTGGTFSVDVAVGTYTVTGTSPQYQGGLAQCHADAPVVVRRGHTTKVTVICPIR
jgi:hypothetical protein